MDRREQGNKRCGARSRHHRYQQQLPTPLLHAAQARLIALVAAQQLALPMAEMEARLEALMVMLPDLGGWRLRLWCPCAT